MSNFRMLSASGLLGYGFPEESLRNGLARDPHMIGVDGGSTDPGPHYLGSGKTLNSRRAMKRDIKLMLIGARAHHIPLVIGSCGGAVDIFGVDTPGWGSPMALTLGANAGASIMASTTGFDSERTGAS